MTSPMHLRMKVAQEYLNWCRRYTERDHQARPVRHVGSSPSKQRTRRTCLAASKTMLKEAFATGDENGPIL
ncbi:hypothetical protein P280DRAFT_470594 [Massarina eburnea CBS 473.64]|uniref:Uncharacterized protein n=1 Tax=Massarina eburnea CBS 473.64 TaxID=1395130 RepID=A0A6A6RWS6_9PLEO|nr:hypothetical protein P280DRAFT_470594 [Massarina eburnea CBS 473.64]